MIDNPMNTVELTDYPSNNSVSSISQHSINILKSYSSAYELQTTENIKKICSSPLYSNWEYELYVKKHQGEDKDMLSDHFPLLVSTMNIISNPLLFIISCMITLWNTIAVTVSLLQCSLISSDHGFELSAMFFPIMFLITHYELCIIWRGKLSIHDIFKPASYKHKNSLRSLLNLIVIYINESEAISSFPIDDYHHLQLHQMRNEYHIKYFIIFGILPIATMITWISKSINNASYQQECIQYYYVTAGYFSIFYGLMISLPITVYLINMIYMSSMICSSLISSWIIRYYPLQRIKSYDLQYYIHQHHHDNMMISSSFRRDAYERYLMIHHYVHHMSRIFAPAIVTFLSVNGALFIWYIYLAFITTDYVTVIIWIIVSVLIFFFTMNCITSCNKIFDKSYRIIKYSIPIHNDADDDDDDNGDKNDDGESKSHHRPFLGRDPINKNGDYAVIGGREEWMEYMMANPVYWTVYGFAFTQAWLQSLAVAAATAMIVTVVPTITAFIV